uniref:Uncharacterized protein n=1 Tax=Daphnia galeata TaxID=27404 RepID=A0A8J2RP61_9CRUS|nr:unnamed protein product [Daphnia galeata]
MNIYFIYNNNNQKFACFITYCEVIHSSPKISRQKLMSLSGGYLLNQHVDCGLNYKYFPVDSIFKFNMVEDLILWEKGYSSHLEESLIKHVLKPEDMITVDKMIIAILICLFARNKDILEYFRDFENTFEKSSVISTILRTVTRKHGPFLNVILCTSVMKNWFQNNNRYA